MKKMKNEGTVYTVLLTFHYIFRQETEHQLSKLHSVIRSSSTLYLNNQHKITHTQYYHHHHNSWCEREGVIAHYIEHLTIVTSFC